MLTKLWPFAGTWIRVEQDLRNLKQAQDEALSILEKRSEFEKVKKGLPSNSAVIVQGQNCRVIFR